MDATMTRPKNNPPVGALEEPIEGPSYTVDKIFGHIEKRNARPGPWWFKPSYSQIKLGFCFSNYFHAYAYSLKCKERNRDPVDTA